LQKQSTDTLSDVLITKSQGKKRPVDLRTLASDFGGFKYITGEVTNLGFLTGEESFKFIGPLGMFMLHRKT